MATTRRRNRGSIENRPDRVKGRYRAVVYAGIDPLTGKPRYLRKSADTYVQAQVELTKLLNSVDEKRHPKSAASTSAPMTRCATLIVTAPLFDPSAIDLGGDEGVGPRVLVIFRRKAAGTPIDGVDGPRT